MEHSAPPLFRQGPSAAARLVAFVGLSVVLMVADARFKMLEQVRRVVATVVYPVQVAARAPGNAFGAASQFFVSQASVTQENARLKAQHTGSSAAALRTKQLEGENAHLRRLLDTRDALQVRSTAAEVIYDARDVFARKVILDKGSQAGLAAGQIVVDEGGVLGQVSRVHPLTSEVTLVTDKDHAVPVQVVRTGLRGVVYGQAQSAMLELRFMPANVDIQEGDTLVTSGLDGVYMPGLPVGKVTRIEREAGYAFAKIQCQPAAGVTRYSHVLVLSQERKNLPPLPQAVDEGKDKRGKRKFEERDNLEAAKDASAKATSPADSKAVSGSSGAGGGNVVSNVPSTSSIASPSTTNSTAPAAKAAQ